MKSAQRDANTTRWL